MKTYVLISRHDTEMGETICSLSQLELYEKMKAEYDEAKKELERISVVSYASCCDTSAMIIAGGDGWEWNITSHELSLPISPGQYMGTQLDFEKFMSKDRLLQRLEESGSNYRALDEIRTEYSAVFGVDLVWNYILDDDLHTGFMMIPVKEGFLSLPYDEIRKETFEQYLLDEAKLFDVESMEHAIDNFRRYSVALLQAMEEAKSLITKEE